MLLMKMESRALLHRIRGWVAVLLVACAARRSDERGSASGASALPASSTARTAAELAAETAPPGPAREQALPALVDLRPELLSLGLVPRAQGARGTCSVFTTCSALEFALAKRRGRAERLSVEFLNWAASQAAGRPSDGAFFHDALAGFERFGICGELAWPYREGYDAALAPTPSVLEQAAQVREETGRRLIAHWIAPWQANHFGLSDAELAEVKAVLSRGYPVAAGAGHSRLLVGYRDDPSAPGGGAFATEDSGLGRFDEVSFDFVQREVADVFWIEAR